MSGRACLSEDELVAAIHGELAHEAADHLDGCHRCSRRVALLKRVALTGVEPIDEVIAEVDSLVARLLVTRREQWWRVARDPEYQRPDVVKRLMALADEAGDQKEAVALVRTATRIVDALPADTTPALADLRFETWKLASAILREAGEYGYAEAALIEAEQAAGTASDPELADAIVLLSRAQLSAEPDIWRPDDASSLLGRAEKVFAHRGDTARQQVVLTARASLSYRSGDYRSACTAFAEILAATPTEPRERYLGALTNLIAARLACGEANEEVQHSIELLIQEYEARGRADHLARARWLMGHMRRLHGEYDLAADLYRCAMREVGDADAALRAGLRLLETLLLADRYDEALLLARELYTEAVALDRRERSRRRSLTAEVLAYAREAAHRGALTADLVSELLRYVDRIDRQRPVDFIPPMPLAPM